MHKSRELFKSYHALNKIWNHPDVLLISRQQHIDALRRYCTTSINICLLLSPQFR